MKTLKQIIKLGIFLLIFGLFYKPVLALARIPNDPFAEQWSFEDSKVYEAWDKTTGSRDVVVAVIDNGFDTFHPDLYPNAWKNEDEVPDNGIDDDKNGFIDDVWGWDFSSYDVNHDNIFTDAEMDGNNNPRPWVVGRQQINDDIHHGSLVAGIIGAVGNNGVAGTGINWQVRLMNLKVIEVSGVGDLTPLHRAIYYAVDNGADVINISLVGDVDDRVKESIKYAYDNGVAVIAASGNDRIALNLSPVYPVCADAGEDEEWVLGVSAIDEDHYLASFSNTGSSCIDITAPGVSVSSTMRYAPRQGLEKLYGDNWNGTSFAAPFVSGAAALIKAIQPSWGAKQIYEAILSTVHRTPPDDVSAYEEVYGAGLLQIANAVDYAFSHIVSTHPLLSFLEISLDDGNIVNKTLKYQNIKTVEDEAVKGVDDITQYDNGYVGIKEINNSKSEVVFWDNNWKKQNSWQISSDGKSKIVAGDILGDNEIEIVVAPSYGGRQVMRVFDKTGKELNKLDSTNVHRGVSLGLIDTISSKKEILAVYRDDDKVNFYHFDKDLELIMSKEVSFIQNTGEIASGDIDGDGVQDIVVGGGAGDVPYIAYYNLDGSLKRKFFGYDTNHSGGLKIFVGDYDSDGKDDVLVAPNAKNGAIRVWSNRSKKLAQWDFDLPSKTKFLPVYNK